MSDSPQRRPHSFENSAVRAESWPRRIAILGVGLLGGSVALAIRRARPTVEIAGLVRSPQTRDRALACGAIDSAVGDLKDACRGCDVVVVATPVDQIAPLVIGAAAASPDGCLITDVGSTKAGIVNAVLSDPAAAKKFVAAHPIAGGEKSGVEHASATLFDGKLVVITPSHPNATARPGILTENDGGAEAEGVTELGAERTRGRAHAKGRCAEGQEHRDVADRAEAFWRLTGARTAWMSPDEHDAHLASTSHVPHLVAAALATLVTAESKSLVGAGWLDATRIAAGDPVLWTAIVNENRSAILSQLERFRGNVDELVRRIAAGDDEQLTAWLAEAKRVRDQAGEANPPN